MVSTPFNTFLGSIAERGLSIIGLAGNRPAKLNVNQSISLCHMLLSARGEASGIALSHEILGQYATFDEGQRTSFFRLLRAEFLSDHEATRKAAAVFLSDPTPQNLVAMADAAIPPFRELLIRLNQAADATRLLVNMRADLLDRLRDFPELQLIDREFASQFTSWFNRGFLELRDIDWNTPAAILEKIIKYEAVHGMAGWDDLRERIDPEDRLIFGFFHPRLGDEPLIFVEVALMDDMPSSIASVLNPDRQLAGTDATTAVFYSISNCQKGLRGIPLGNFLIKQVVENLRNRFPKLKEFVTLSPIPSFSRALLGKPGGQAEIPFGDETIDIANGAIEEQLLERPEPSSRAAKELLAAAQWFLYSAKGDDDRPVDPVARFHLGNGARLERVNWCADISKQGLKNSLGLMVNYRYRLDEIERNHEQFANDGTIAASPGIVRAAKGYENGARRVHSDQIAREDARESNGEETTVA